MRALRHLSLQLLAGVGAWVFIAPGAHPAAWALLQGLLAALASLALRQPGWQRLAHGLFVPAAVLLLRAQIPAGWYLATLLALLAFGRNALTERVPLYRSGREAEAGLDALLPEGARLLEAGCGDGRLAVGLALQRPDLRVLALENAVGSWLLARLRWLAAGRPAGLALGCRSFWTENWGNHDAIYVFLSPEPMPRVWSKFLAEGRPGCLLISNTFAVPDIEPDERLPLGGPLQKELLIWRRPHGPQ
ncbi:SAM-dependent methyltransferase [Chromobacterium alticapitis]|uniref:SAM-dependent methyltransferase n=1 Tax=Chromobacterium alticapitis TaxID=2073169 RepID=A0A2S5DDI9_9NEIS|nr:SAM-dependent methyltransferase [Chromobacterium alticapitis]POZ61124.1 SAM-dependent methyltransferase [Chromobacterium alticapitis]